MKLKSIFLISFLGLTPLVLFWGCGSISQPLSPANSSVMTIKVPPVGFQTQFLVGAENEVLYNIKGSATSVTGSYGPLSAVAIAGSISFSVPLNGSINNYNLVSLEIINSVTQQALAVGAATLSGSGNAPVTLGPVNKGCYQVSSLTSGYGYGFENNTLTNVGANTPTSVSGIDVVSNITSNSLGYELDNPALTNDTVAYMGNGNLVNYLSVPSSFNSSSSFSKKSVIGGGGQPVALGDVYCVKMKAGGYAWLQITGPGIVGISGPSFIFRLNTTLTYCGYEQTTADLASSPSNGTPTPYAPQVVFNVTSNDYGVAVYPTNGAATSIYVVDSGSFTDNAFVQPFNALATPGATFGALSWPGGMAINSAGTTLYVSDPAPNSHNVQMYSLPNGTSIGTVGNASVLPPLPDIAAAVTNGEMASPNCVAVAPNGNLFVTDSGTSGFADVLVMQAPTTTLGHAVTYWNGQISTGTSPAGIATDGTTVYIADSSNNQIETYNINGVSGSTWTSDNNPNGIKAFSGPQGIALDVSAGLIFIADTGNNRVVEMTTLGIFKAAWGTWGLGPTVTPSTFNSPAAIAVDGAVPPNVFVADSGNQRVLEFKGL